MKGRRYGKGAARRARENNFRKYRSKVEEKESKKCVRRKGLGKYENLLLGDYKKEKMRGNTEEKYREKENEGNGKGRGRTL